MIAIAAALYEKLFTILLCARKGNGKRMMNDPSLIFFFFPQRYSPLDSVTCAMIS